MRPREVFNSRHSCSTRKPKDWPWPPSRPSSSGSPCCFCWMPATRGSTSIPHARLWDDDFGMANARWCSGRSKHAVNYSMPPSPVSAGSHRRDSFRGETGDRTGSGQYHEAAPHRSGRRGQSCGQNLQQTQRRCHIGGTRSVSRRDLHLLSLNRDVHPDIHPDTPGSQAQSGSGSLSASGSNRLATSAGMDTDSDPDTEGPPDVQSDRRSRVSVLPGAGTHRTVQGTQRDIHLLKNAMATIWKRQISENRCLCGLQRPELCILMMLFLTSNHQFVYHQDGGYDDEKDHNRAG